MNSGLGNHRQPHYKILPIAKDWQQRPLEGIYWGLQPPASEGSEIKSRVSDGRQPFQNVVSGDEEKAASV